MPNSFDGDTVGDLVNDNVRVHADAVAAIRAYRAAKPWRGTFEEQWAKLDTLHTALKAAYGMTCRLVYVPTPNPEMRDGGYCPAGSGTPYDDCVVLAGKVSVVTYLLGIGFARGKDRREAMGWAVSVFKRFFPRSFAGCDTSGPMLVRAE
jgi:hypothetical protein